VHIHIEKCCNETLYVPYTKKNVLCLNKKEGQEGKTSLDQGLVPVGRTGHNERMVEVLCILVYKKWNSESYSNCYKKIGKGHKGEIWRG
jgi:hypothetical protein